MKVIFLTVESASTYKNKVQFSHSFVSDSLRPHELQHARLLSTGILQARVLEWIAIPFSTGTSQPRDRTLVSCITGRSFTV